MEFQILGFNLTKADFEKMLRSIVKEEVVNNSHSNDKTLDNDSQTSANYITTNEAAKMCNVAKITLWNWARNGKISKTRIGKKVFYLRSELEAILKQNTTKKANLGF